MNYTKAFEALFGDPLKIRLQHTEDAIREQATALSDAEFNRSMADFYTELAMTTDPWKDHMGFADARTKQLDYQARWARDQKRVEEATKLADAERARYVQLQHKLHGIGQADPS